MHILNYRDSTAYIAYLVNHKSDLKDDDCICKTCHCKVLYKTKKTEKRPFNEDCDTFESPSKIQKLICCVTKHLNCGQPVYRSAAYISSDLLCECFGILELLDTDSKVLLCKVPRHNCRFEE